MIPIWLSVLSTVIVCLVVLGAALLGLRSGMDKAFKRHEEDFK